MGFLEFQILPYLRGKKKSARFLYLDGPHGVHELPENIHKTSCMLSFHYLRGVCDTYSQFEESQFFVAVEIYRVKVTVKIVSLRIPRS